MKHKSMKLVALILATVLALTGCGKQEVSESSPALNEIEEPQVLTLLLMYDGFEEDYLSHYEYRGILINGEEQTSFDGNEICYNTIGNHLDECAEFFEANKNQAVEDEVNLRLTTYTEVTDWFPSSFSILTDEGEKSYEISKVLMRVSTTGVTEEEKDKIKISDLMPNQYGAYSYANSLHFWLFGRETDGAVEEEFTDPNFSLTSEETEESSEESIEETETVETETEQDETPLEINMSDYLKSKEIIWLELDPKDLVSGANPTADTHVAGILITEPDGTVKEARTTVSNFGTLGDFSQKTDEEIKKIATDFINDFSNYEMVPCMSDAVKKELQKYIASPHHYTLTGVDINEWRNIKNYLVLSFESTTPEILNQGNMLEGFSVPKDGGYLDFEYGVKQQNIEIYGGGRSQLQINDSFYAYFFGEKAADYPMVVREPEKTSINTKEKDSPNVLWNPETDLYPEKILIKESEYIDEAMVKETPVKYSSFIRKNLN